MIFAKLTINMGQDNFTKYKTSKVKTWANNRNNKSITVGETGAGGRMGRIAYRGAVQKHSTKLYLKGSDWKRAGALGVGPGAECPAKSCRPSRAILKSDRSRGKRLSPGGGI